MRKDATGKFSSRCPLPERKVLASIIAVQLLPSNISLGAAFPHAAAAAGMLIGGIEGERHIDRGNGRQRRCPYPGAQSGQAVKSQGRPEGDSHHGPGEKSNELRKAVGKERERDRREVSEHETENGAE